MATFFGEVVYQTSRAYDEDEQEHKYNVDIDLKDGAKDKIASCSLFSIGYGVLASDYSETVLKDDNSIDVGRIQISREGCNDLGVDTGDFHLRKPQQFSLYITRENILVCWFMQDINNAVVNKVATKLLSLVSTDCEILVHTTHHYAKLKGAYNTDDDSNCAVFLLTSPRPSSVTLDCPKLPQPATIDSLPAAVLTKCIAKNRPCNLLAAFTETFSTGDLSLIVGPLTKLMSAYPLAAEVVSDIGKETFWKYRTKNPRFENLDRYM